MSAYITVHNANPVEVAHHALHSCIYFELNEPQQHLRASLICICNKQIALRLWHCKIIQTTHILMGISAGLCLDVHLHSTFYLLLHLLHFSCFIYYVYWLLIMIYYLYLSGLCFVLIVFIPCTLSWFTFVSCWICFQYIISSWFMTLCSIIWHSFWLGCTLQHLCWSSLFNWIFTLPANINVILYSC